MRAPDPRPWWQAAVEVGCTAVAFKAAADFAARFAEASGVSYLFPPSAVILAAGAAFGWRGVAGVALGSLFSRWGAAATLPGAVLFAVLHALTTAIPATMLHRPAGGTARRLLRALVWGVVVNNLASALGGTALLVTLDVLPGELPALANHVLLWWTSDVMAALSLGLPLLVVVWPEALLAEDSRELLRAWLRNPRQVGACAALLAVGLALLGLLESAGWGFPQWAAVALVAPVALAALGGGVGAALLANLGVSGLYFALLLGSRVGDAGVDSTAQLVGPAYLILVFFASFALVGGWLAGRNRILLRRVERQERMLRQDFERIVVALSGAIEAKDRTTEGHAQRVAALTLEVGRRLGMQGEELQVLRYGALLHDVGKIGVPESVLDKPGPLTAEERELMMAHVAIGVRILSGIDVLQEVVPLVQYHQERWDGATRGVRYPGYHGLRGEEIPLGARILAVVDAFDAITHDRPYRAGQPISAAVEELRREAGHQFDPAVVTALLGLIAEGWLGGDAATGAEPAREAVPRLTPS